MVKTDLFLDPSVIFFGIVCFCFNHTLSQFDYTDHHKKLANLTDKPGGLGFLNMDVLTNSFMANLKNSTFHHFIMREETRAKRNHSIYVQVTMHKRKRV